MPEISVDQATICENAITQTLQMIQDAPEEITKALVEAQQILGGIIEKGQQPPGAAASDQGQGGPM